MSSAADDVPDEHALAALLDRCPPPRESDSASSTGRPLRLSVVLNPHAGARNAEPQWGVAQALLRAHQILPDPDLAAAVRRTEREGDGRRLGQQLRVQWDAQENQRELLVILGGDGTVHEVLNGILLGADAHASKVDADDQGSLWHGAGRVEVVLIPSGTANALYYYLFPPESTAYPTSSPVAPYYSLLSCLSALSAAGHAENSPTPTAVHPSRLLPLPLALNRLPPPAPSHTLTTVVSSAALHAALLHDAEALRATHPGVERFKLAAAKNVTTWWDGEMILRGNPRVYDPLRRAWVPAGSSSAAEGKGQGGGPITVRGPFAYLVSAQVSRFEPTFVVAPFRSPLHELAPRPEEEGPTLDIVAIRPLRRRPTAELVRAGEGDRAREEFVRRIWAVTGGMYDGGKHVDELYAQDEIAAAAAADGEDGPGRAVCEVWRAEEIEWVPVAVEGDLKSRLVCLDGDLHDLGTSGGSLRMRAVGGASSAVRVWA